MHDSYEKETTSSSDVTDTNEDTEDTDDDECGRSVLDKLDVTYQRAFTASEKQAPSAHQKNHQLTGIHKKHQ